MNHRKNTFRGYFAGRFPRTNYEYAKQVSKLHDDLLTPQEQEYKLQYLDAREQWEFRVFVHRTLHV